MKIQKMHVFVGGGLLLGMIPGASNATYVCDVLAKEYTSCVGGYYLSDVATCERCPTYEYQATDKYIAIDELLMGQDDEYTLTQCAVSFNESFVIPNGTVDANAVQCAVVTDDSFVDEGRGMEPGSRVCVVHDYSQNTIHCDEGYTLDMTGNNRYEAASFDTSLRFVTSIDEIKCVPVPAGSYGSTWRTAQCSDDQDIGLYCPGGTAAGVPCPQATNTVGDIVVHGITGITGATSMSQCYLPSDDRIEYTDSIGTYKLKDKCDFEQ